MSMRFAAGVVGLTASLSLALPAESGAAALDQSDGCYANVLPRADDMVFGPFALPFTFNSGSASSDSVYVLNNGRLAFAALADNFSPTPLSTLAFDVIAPFWADVDTTTPGSGQVYYGTTTFAGRPAFCVTWSDAGAGPGVGFYQNASRLNRFQVLLVDRPDAADDNIVFNYDQIQWEASTVSGSDANGLGGNTARVGYRLGGESVEFPGSGIPGSFLDSNPATGLVHDSLSSATLGRYVFGPAGLDVRGEKLEVLSQLNGLLLTANKRDAGKLQEASKKLTASLDPSLWIDGNHLQANGGGKVFDGEKDAVEKLAELSKKKDTQVPAAILQSLIHALVEADAQLAQTALDEAIAANGDPKKIGEAQKELAKANDPDADDKASKQIDRYKRAWRAALEAVKKR